MEKELPSYLREGRLAMCVLSRQRIIVTLRRVTVSRDDIESATRKSEVNCSGFSKYTPAVPALVVTF